MCAGTPAKFNALPIRQDTRAFTRNMFPRIQRPSIVGTLLARVLPAHMRLGPPRTPRACPRPGPPRTPRACPRPGPPRTPRACPRPGPPRTPRACPRPGPPHPPRACPRPAISRTQRAGLALADPHASCDLTYFALISLDAPYVHPAAWAVYRAQWNSSRPPQGIVRDRDALHPRFSDKCFILWNKARVFSRYLDK
jgi:hypothetical protein